MIRVCLFILGIGMTSTAWAEFMRCDQTKRCHLVCYFPSNSAKTERVYPNDGTPVDRVRVEPVGDYNLLYIAERADGTGTKSAYQPLESLILPKDYPCRLSPNDSTKDLAASKG